MSIHRENALKAHQHHILFYTCHLKKTTILIQNLIKIFIKKYQIAFFFKFSQGSMPPSMCAADIIISV